MINMFKDTVLVSLAFSCFMLLCAAIESFPIPTLLAVFVSIAIFSKSYWLFIDNSDAPVYNKIVRVTKDVKGGTR